MSDQWVLFYKMANPNKTTLPVQWEIVLQWWKPQLDLRDPLAGIERD